MATATPVARPGRRAPDALRKIAIVYEGLARVDGSARFAFGHTAALASCSGPSEVRPLSELPSSATLDVLVRPLSGLPGPSSKALASTIRSILLPTLELERYPRSLVQIVVQALSAGTSAGAARSGGGYGPALLAACVNAAGCAVLNAGSVGMRGVLCAVAVGRRRRGEGEEVDLVLDPDEGEQVYGGGCFAFLVGVPADAPSTPSEHGIPPIRLVWTNYSASSGGSAGLVSLISRQELDRATNLATKGARDVWRTIQESAKLMYAATPSIGTREGQARKPAQAETKSDTTIVREGGGGEFEDEMEEVGDDDEARMEI